MQQILMAMEIMILYWEIMGIIFICDPDEQHPVKLWMNDFDMNTLPDKVFSRTIDGKDFLFF